MPTVTLNKKVFEQLVGKELPLEELKDRISMLGTDLEKIEDNEIEVEIFPNRPDMLSEQGFARAFSSFIGVKTGLRKYEVKKSGDKVIVDGSVTVRPYTACAIVKNITFTDERIRETMQIQEKLSLTHGRNRKKSEYGIYPLKSITFPISYVAKDPRKIKFQPLGFDHEMLAIEVERKHPKGREFAHLTETWDKYPFFIDNNDKVMSMLPYTNSYDTGKIDETTTEIFIECTGTDQNNVIQALNIFVTMFAEMGADIYSLDIEYPDKTITTPNLDPEKMKLDLAYINKRLGLKLSEKQAKELLEKMGYGYQNKEVLIPAYRADIIHQVDLSEDIAIAYGYENFVEEIPNVATIGEEAPLEKFYRKVREILIGLNLIEAKNYHLLTKEELNDKMNKEERIIGLKNALGEHNHLRNRLLSSLMKNLKENQHNEYPQNIFEIGRIFNYGNTETGVVEKEHLAIALCHEKTGFTEMRQVLDALIAALGLQVRIKETSSDSFIPGRVGEIVVKEKKVGILGEFSPEVITNWDLSVPVVGLELDLEKLFKLISEEKPIVTESKKTEEVKPIVKQENKPVEKIKGKKTAGEFVRIDTERLFYQDPYLKEAEATVENINGKEIVLDKTLFFAFSGGQASDLGTINKIHLVDVKKENNKMVHVLEKEPNFKVGDKVKLELDWERRYKLMKLHSAAHLVYYPFVEILGKPKIVGSNINPDKARVDFLYSNPITEKIPQIEKEVNKIISKNLDITTTPDEKNPEKRWWSCSSWKMPCGGTHVKNTSEIGKIKLKRKNIGQGKERVEIYLDES